MNKLSVSLLFLLHRRLRFSLSPTHPHSCPDLRKQMGRNGGTREMCESQGATSRQVTHTSRTGQTLNLPTAPWAVLSRPRYGGRFGHVMSQYCSPSPHPRTTRPALGQPVREEMRTQ